MKSCKVLREHLRKTNYNGFVSFVTNGILFKDDWIDFFVDREGPGEVNFSVNASTKDVYDSMIKFGDFERAIYNLRQLIARKMERNKHNLIVRMSFVIYQKNVWDVLSYCNLFFELRADKLVYFLDGRGSALEDYCSSLGDDKLIELQSIIGATISRMEQNSQHPSEISTLEYMVSQTLKARRGCAA